MPDSSGGSTASAPFEGKIRAFLIKKTLFAEIQHQMRLVLRSTKNSFPQSERSAGVLQGAANSANRRQNSGPPKIILRLTAVTGCNRDRLYDFEFKL